MMLTDNLHTLKNKFPSTFNQIENLSDSHAIKVVESKSGGQTLFIEEAGDTHYIHSKYNPHHEADVFMGQYAQIEYEHVLFYGVGLGYHIDRFIQKHPVIPFSIYEPNIEIFRCFLTHKNLKQWPQLKNIYLEENSDQCCSYTHDFVNKTNGYSLIITLPSYERIFKEKYTLFANSMKECLRETQKIVQLRHAFEKKWIINSIDNMRFTIKANNMFEKKPYFLGKPVIIVAAGPSLEEELEHLRHIKSNGLAYIFAVGSAINSLLHHEIIPDGACTYDPHFHNVNVLRKVIDEQIKGIPLIYGTTVGCGTLADYPGKQFYAVTNKDEIARLLLRSADGNLMEMVEDAPSIAVIAIQLFHSLGSNRIILVGQNLAFRNNHFYAPGVHDSGRSLELMESDMEDAFLVEDVQGNPVYTNWPLNTMRLEMERFIARYTDVEIINTTQGGAKIKGTLFMELKDVIQKFLKEEINTSDWSKDDPTLLDLEYIQLKAGYLHEEYLALLKLLEASIQIFIQMDRSIKVSNTKKATKLIDQFDTVFEIIQKNQFYKTILKPMNLLQLELIVMHFDTIRLEPSVLVKTKKTLEKFGKLIHDFRQDISSIEGFYLRMQHAIKEKTMQAQ